MEAVQLIYCISGSEHEKYKSYVFMWLCIPFPVRHQFINLIKMVLLSIRNQYHIKSNIFLVSF